MLHFIPIPKTGSEATKRILSSSSVTAQNHPDKCINKTFCFIPPGTHEMNTHLPRLHDDMPLPTSRAWFEFAHVAGCSTARNVLRIATIRNPYERFVSTFSHNEKLGALVPYGIPKGCVPAHSPSLAFSPPALAFSHLLSPSLSRSTSNPEALLRNRSAMADLISGRPLHRHFLPAVEFVAAAPAGSLVHVLLRYAHLEADFNLLLRSMRKRSPWPLLPAEGRGRVAERVSFGAHTNDPITGVHDYYSKLSPASMARIEFWYRKDFEMLGFPKLSIRTPSAAARHAWVGQACSPLTDEADSADGWPKPRPARAFNVSDWPSALVCSSVRTDDIRSRLPFG